MDNNINFDKLSGIKNNSNNEIDNDNILFYTTDPSELYKNNKELFEKSMNELNKKCQNLSIKINDIVNNKKFDFKSFLENNLNIQLDSKIKIKENKSNEIIYKENIIKIDNEKFIINNKSDNKKNSKEIKNEKKKSIDIEQDDFLGDILIDNLSREKEPENNFLGKKRKNSELNKKNQKKNECNKIYNEIENICGKYENNKINKMNIKLIKQNKITTIFYDNTLLASLYFDEYNNINKLLLASNSATFTVEKEIVNQLKNIKKSISNDINGKKKKFKLSS